MSVAPALSVRVATHRFVGLTALRWLPNGLTVPVTVLLASSRGLSVAEIGLVFLVHGVVVTVLELPTGGLADAIGRRPVLVLSVLLHLAGLLTLAVAHEPLAFAAAFALVGAGRALDSGPLESWYVDTVDLAEPGADVTPGLSRAGIADGLALAAGAAVGGLLPWWVGGASSGALVVPLLVAAAVDLAYLVALLLLVTPTAASAGAVGSGPSSGLRDVPAIVRSAVSSARQDRTLRLLFATAFAMGLVLYTLELLGPLHFADLTDGRASGSAVFGVVVALSFLAAAAGSALAATARRAARGSVRGATAVLFLTGAALLVALALAGTIVLAATAYCAFYLANGASSPLRRQVLHARVGAAVRSSTVSAWSLCLQAGGITGGLLVPQLAQRAGTPAAFAAAGCVLVVAAVLSLGLPSGAAAAKPRRVELDSA